MTRTRQRTTPPDIAAWIPMIEGIVALLHPHAEVVVHDTARDQVLAIWNPFSKRKVGDPSLLGELPASGFGVFGPYEKVGVDGHRIVSTSIEIADGAALVCINLDRSPLDDAIGVLQQFARAVVPQPAALFERDWREEIQRVVDDWCRSEHASRARLTREQRVEIVRVLDDKGLFATRNAGSFVATALGVSRATVYNLMKEVRS